MAKIFDPQIINPMLTAIIDELVTVKGNIAPNKACDIKAQPIHEYDERMRVNAADKFDVSVYLSAASFYLTEKDMQEHRARGTMIFYMDSEVADKIFKAIGLQVPYDEDDENMMSLCSGICKSIAHSLRDRLAAEGFAKLLVSEPVGYKNSISEGVEFAKDQEEKQEICFFFFKHKALAIDWTMAPLPKK